MVCVGDALKTLDPVQFNKWSHYLLLKASFYESYVKNITYTPLRIQALFNFYCTCTTHTPTRPTASLVKNYWCRRNVESPIRVLQHSQACQFYTKQKNSYTL